MDSALPRFQSGVALIICSGGANIFCYIYINNIDTIKVGNIGVNLLYNIICIICIAYEYKI